MQAYTGHHLKLAEVERLAEEVFAEFDHPSVRRLVVSEILAYFTEPALDVFIVVHDEAAGRRVDPEVYLGYSSTLREKIAARGDDRWVYSTLGTEEDLEYIASAATRDEDDEDDEDEE